MDKPREYVRQAHQRGVYYRLIARLNQIIASGPRVDDRGRVRSAEYAAKVSWLQDKARASWRSR